MTDSATVETVNRQFAASRQYVDKTSGTIPGSVNSNVRLLGFPFPLCFERGEGAYLYDLDGNRFIDYALGMGPAVLGHAPKSVCDAVAQSLGKGQMLGGQNPIEWELAKALQSHIPCAEMVRIGMTGSEVVQAALRVSRAYTGKRKVIKFEGQYHGWYDNVLVNHSPAVLSAEDAIRVPYAPHLETKGQVDSGLEDLIIMPWNDAAAIERVLKEQGDQIAAIITEPVMCNTGVIAPSEGYLEALRQLATQHNVVLIFDEVITGFRLSLGGAQERLGVTPDLATFAKAMAAGFPISALAGKAEIMSLFGDGTVNHSGTYNSNLPSAYAALATLEALAANDGAALAGIEARGNALIAGIRALSDKAGAALRVSGYGGVFNTYFADPDHVVRDYQSYKHTDLAAQSHFMKQLVCRKIRPTNRGTWFVSAALSDGDVEETLAAVEQALAG